MSLLAPVAVLATALSGSGETRTVPPAGTTAEAAPAVPAPPAAADDEDLDVDLSEPDFTVVTLPTNLRVPRHKLAFRLTHRFSRPLGEGSFSDLASDLFGLDSGAQIGLGLRFGLRRGTQVGVYRTSDRTIELHGQQELLREGKTPIGLSLVGSVEGLDNFQQDFSPAIGLVASKRLGTHGAVYLAPSWVGNTRIVSSAPGNEDSTLVLGLGARLCLTRTMSVLGEVHPRLAGYMGDLGSGAPDPLATFGIEWRVGGHSFQLNFSNALATTPAQVARGAQGLHGWFIGFNLTRKFF